MNKKSFSHDNPYLGKIIIALLTVVFIMGFSFSALASSTVYGNKSGFNLEGYQPSGNGLEDVIAIATKQKGRNGETLGYTFDWCAAFVVDCMHLAEQTNAVPSNATFCNELFDQLKSAGVQEVSSGQRGDIVFFGHYTSSGWRDFGHVGILLDPYTTIEGNVNGNSAGTRYVASDTMSHKRSNYDAIAFLRPDYSNTLAAYIDVNGYLDGASHGSLENYGLFDITVGDQVFTNRNDYYARHNIGTSYNIDPASIRANPGFEFTGIRIGDLKGTIRSNNTIEISLSFATQGNLLIQGNLDGIYDNSINGYGTFDLYINGGEIIERNLTSYQKQWPMGTTYEVKNIQVANGKNYDVNSSTGLSGTITSNTQSKTILYFTSDGTASTEWQEGRSLPGNLNADELDIEYNNHYEMVSSTSPGTGWVQGSVARTYYQNTGNIEEYPYERSTSDSYVYVGGYYYHWCGSNHDCNYLKTPGKYETYHGPNSLESFNVVSSGKDTNNSSVKWYKLNWKPGEVYSGAATCATNQTANWYRMYQYQPRVLITEYNWTKDTGWSDVRDPSATSFRVRWRYKGGIPPIPLDEYVLTINGWLDGMQSDNTFDYGCFDLYADGELVAKDCWGIEMTFDHNPVYSIENIRTTVGKKYDGTHLGKITGDIPSGNATVTLSFTTVIVISENWTETDSISDGLDLTGCEVEYKNHYVTTGRTSPGEEWKLYTEGAVQYENDGSLYESDNELPTSETRVLVGHYYFHYCDGGELANYYKKDYLPIKHTISMDQVSHFRVEYKGTDGDGSGRKYYYLYHLDGDWAGGRAQCGTPGSYIYYEGNVYQNKKAYRINTYVHDSEWTNERDPMATSATVRIRLKSYDVSLDGNGGTPNISLKKYYDMFLDISENVPKREDYIFSGWNTKADGTGESYDAETVYTANAPLMLYAQWTPVAVAVLPAETKVVEEGAFEGSDVRIVRIPSGCTRIEARAFAGCTHLSKIFIPRSVSFIDTSAFDGIESLIIVGDEDSIAELYAFKRNWIMFEMNN